MFGDNDDFYDRDLFMMSETYRDMTPDWVFPELNYLKEEDNEYWNREEEETPVINKSSSKSDYDYYQSEEYKEFKKRLDDSWVKEVKQCIKFYRKHKILDFIRESMFWAPRNFKNAPEYIKKRAEEEIRKGI
jgi:hypothetical protein|nr:MAG TPA: hypothetical protein [Caudoviricetes sp.]